MKKTPAIIELGTINYQQALQIQHDQFKKVLEDPNQETIFLLDHPAVVTVGYNRSAENELKWTEQQLNNNGIELYKSDRGGAATLHSPGQLVCYPILNLRSRKWGVRYYVSWLESLILSFLNDYKLEGKLDSSRPGVYIGDDKIASVGIRIEMGVSRHGIAINCCNDVSLFDSISVCGQAEQKVTSIALLTNSNDQITNYNHQFKKTLLKILSL